MKLKNNALQELYDTLANGTISFSPYAESPVAKAFRECDEALKVLQDRNNILEKTNRTLIGANLDLCSSKRDLENRIEQLEKERDDLLIRVHHAEDKVMELEEKGALLKAELKDMKQRYDNVMLSSRIVNERLDKSIADRKVMQENLDYYMDIYSKVQKDYDKLSKENRGLNARNDCLRLEVNWYRKHYQEQSDKIRDLKSRLNSMYGDEYIKKLQDSVRNIGYENGQINLWNMLQNVIDVKPEEFDPECETIGDILSWDLEDFLDAYKKWQEEKEKERLDHMRDYLDRFCRGRLCSECPLGSDEYKCGNGYSFRKFTDNDCRIIPDEELGKYYEKARGCGRCTLKNVTYYFDNKPVNRTISKACENFCKAVRDADIKITENLRKGCTLTANVEVNKDLLAKVCGIAPEDEDDLRKIWKDKK